MLAVDYDFIPTYGVHMAAGRNFSRAYGTDTSNFILNEVAIQAIGWKTPQDAVGKNFKYGSITGHIIGIMNDFHFESLHQKITPLIFIMPAVAPNNSFYNNLSVKIAGNNIPAALTTIKKVWQNYLPEIPYQYTFLDETINNFYKQESQLSELYKLFAGIAIFISCLGLYGLVSFMAVQRTKEMGIRKVLGATARNIVFLLSKEFSILIIIAFAIGSAAAYFIMKGWLQNYTYRINLGVGVFLLALIGSVVIAWLTVGYRAIKAARANPVDNLRTE